MNCSIHKNRFGKVIGVKTQTGEDSVLFKSLAGLPFIETMEEAATLLASSLLYSPTISKAPSHTYETGEPKLFFKTTTGVTESYKTALLNNTDKNVEYGFMGVNGNLIAIGSFSTTTNNDSVMGAINEAISTDLIEEKKVFDGTSYSLKGVGASKLESKVSAVKAYSLLQAVPNNQYQIMAGGFLSLPQAEVELPETEVDTTPVAEVIKNPITAYNTPQELTQQAEQFELDLKEIREKSIANGTFMFAPNGNNSNLSEREWLIVRHPNFINWFGDWINSPETASKVVDKNGEPEVVYHGSNTMGFHKFSISDVKDGGFFFSSNYRISSTYTRENNDISFEVATNKDEALRIAEDKGLTVQIEDEDYYIYSNDGLYAEVSNEEDLILTINNFEQSSPGLAGFFINLRDPMVIDGYGANWDEISGYESSDLSLRLEYNEETDQYDFVDYDDSVEEFSTIVDAYQHIESTYGEYAADKLKDSLEEDQSYGGRGVGEYYYQGDPQTGEEAPLGMTTREWVREATHYNDHDGVIFRDIDDNGPHGTSGTGDVFVVTNPSDIKSLDNIGQFDSNNEDIRFSIDGKLEGISNIPVSQKEVIQVIKPILDSIGVDYEFKNTEELRTLGGTPSNQGGVPKGAVLGETVYLNSEEITLDTPIHELGHLWINKSKLSNPELYNKGMDLINSPEGAIYLQYVRETQPSLEENTVGFYEEALAQAIGDNGARLIKEKSQGFKNFLREFFDWLADKMGISELVSKEGIETLTLKQFSTAVAIELLKGKPVGKIAHKTSYGNDKVSIEVEFLQEQRKEELIRSDQLEVWSDLSQINDFHIIAHGVDNMFTGLMTIKTPDGTYTLEGNGGVYFVTKFGEVWASGSKMKQMHLVNSLNEQLQRNIDEGKGSKTYLLLSSGEPQKLKSNSQGAEGFLHILESLMDGGLISPADFRQSFIDGLNKFQVKNKEKDVIDTPKNVSGKKLKETLNQFFSNPKNNTFALRGNLINQIAQELTSKESFKSNSSSIREFLKLEPGKSLSGKDFIPAVASVMVENFLKGKAPYLGYALVEITKPVVSLDSKHKAYPYAIGYEDGSKPKLILIENPEPTANNIDAYNSNKKDYITPEEAKVNSYHYQNTNVLGGAIGINKGKVNTNKDRKKYFSIGPSYTISNNPKKGKDFKVGDSTITFTQVDNNNITLETIQVPLENKGQEALKQFLQYADQMGVKVSLYVEPKGKQTSRERLIQFYKDNGFVQKYENDEFEMVRYPRVVNFSMAPVNNKPVYTRDDIEEVTDAKRYSEAMTFAIEEMKKAPSVNNKSLQVDIVSETKAQEILDSGGRIFMSKDNMAGGYVLPNGYMGGLFKNPLTTKNRAALPLQQARIEAGGRFFDSYDLNEDTYLKNGFRPLVRMDFNEEYAPENWEETSLVNRPDNVFFVYDPTYKATKGEGDRINDYTEAFSFVTNYLSLENKSANTQGFFSAAVRGEHAPNREWEPEVEFTEKQKTFKQNYYDKHMGNFDAHIATNIPTFRENQIRVASGLVDMLSKEDGTSLIYDIGGSEGGFVKSITDASNGKIRTINLDANKDMQEVHNSNPVEGSVFVNEAFFQGFTDNGVTYNTHIPSEKADVVHESMTFQFISHVREPFIKEVKSKYLKEDGIFLLEEKITPETQEQWEANELVKDEFKLKYYSQQYIDRKKEEVLVGMKANQTPYKTLLSDLKKEFLYVEEYWDSGNFKGVIATNNKEKLNAFLDSIGGKMITKYNEQLYKEIPDSAVNSLIENLVNKGDINLSCGI